MLPTPPHLIPAYNRTRPPSRKDRGLNEPVVSGRFGSDLSQRTTTVAPCSLGVPVWKRKLPAPFQLRRARHSGSIQTMKNHDQRISVGIHHVEGEITLQPEERRRHLYVVGQTGTGKSTLLLNLLRQDIEHGEGVMLLDPHGDLALTATDLIPRSRRNDVIYLDPSDRERPIGFNLLSSVPDYLKPVAADGVVSAFRHVWPDSWGPRLEYILLNAVRALLDVPGGTLLMLPKLLTDDRFRETIVLRHVSDPFVRMFWLQEYAGYNEKFRSEAIAPIQNKIGKALIAPALRNMLSQPSNTITLRRLMDDRAILICNLSKGALGESTSHLLGALLTGAIAQAALSRSDIDAGSRIPFHLYADEFHSFASDGFSLILSEARKYGLTLTVAHQYLDQLPERLRMAVFGNVGSILACRVGASDAELLAEQIGLGGAAALLDLPNFSAWARLLRNGIPTSPIRMSLHPVPHYRNTARGHIELSRKRFGRPRRGVEEKIKNFLRQ